MVQPFSLMIHHDQRHTAELCHPPDCFAKLQVYSALSQYKQWYCHRCLSFSLLQFDTLRGSQALLSFSMIVGCPCEPTYVAPLLVFRMTLGSLAPTLQVLHQNNTSVTKWVCLCWFYCLGVYSHANPFTAAIIINPRYFDTTSLNNI